MNLIRLCLHRPVGVSVGVLLTLLFGFLSLFAIPVQLTPNVDTPIITVATQWTGAQPLEIEREIVERQEEQLRSVRGLKKMTSTSNDNRAEIKLEFYPGADRAEALRDVADKMRQVTGYPIEVDEPTIVAADASIDSPIAWLILYTNSPDESTAPRLRDFAEDFVKPYLDRVEGVADVDIYGGWEREVQVRVDAGELAARGLTFRQVETALQRQNANISAGTRSQGKRDYAVRTVGQYESLAEIENTVVAYTPGGPVYVKDVAKVVNDFKKPQSFVRSKGQTVLAFPVRRETGTNVMEVMAGVRSAIDQVNTEVLKPRGMLLELTQVYDETTYIRQSISMVEWAAVTGGFLTVFVLMFFLRNWRATAAVALAIPVSVIGTFVVVVALGRTLNVISLAGIAFAIGMVVDNSIVVLENIYRHREMGKDVFRACYDGAMEVWGPVLASTLTTLAVFIPVIFVQEEAGQLFRDISVATAAAVSLSLVVSLTVLPVLANRLLRVGSRARVEAVRPQTAGRHYWLGERVANVVAYVNAHPALRPLVILVMTAISFGAIPFLIPPATYLPAGNRNLVFGFLLTPPGYSLDEFRRMGEVIERALKPYWEVAAGTPEQKALDEAWIAQIEGRLAANQIRELNADGKLGALERDRIRREWLTPPPLIDNFFFVSFNGGCFMGCSSRDPARVKPLVRLMTSAGMQIPGVFPVFFQTQLFSFGGGNTLEVQIRGDDLDRVTAAANATYMACAGEFGFDKVRPQPTNFNLGRPELRVVPNRERAADLGLNATDIGFITEAAVNGAFVAELRAGGGDTIDISLYVSGQRGRATRELGEVPIYTPSGQIVPLAAAVTLMDTTSPEQINHVERQRAVTLEISPPETMALETARARVEGEIVPGLRNSKAITDDVLVSFTGNADKLALARATMVGKWEGWNFKSLLNILSSRFLLSVVICYLLMVALYESWLYPFVIMFSVPLAIFGGFVGLAVCHWGTLLTTNQPVQQLDVLTFLGFVILVGTVVNNAILLVDQSLLNLRERGMNPRIAIREAVAARVRPVLMTSLTTVGGQLPLAVMPGAGSELYRGLAAVCVGGMLIATIGTLVLVPAVLGLVFDVRESLLGAAAKDIVTRAEPAPAAATPAPPERPRPPSYPVGSDAHADSLREP